MAHPLCSQKLAENAKLGVNHQGTLMLIFCVLNLIFSLVATLGNLVVIRALCKASSIPTTLKKLFLSLSVSDFAVGLFAQLTPEGTTAYPFVYHFDRKATALN